LISVWIDGVRLIGLGWRRRPQVGEPLTLANQFLDLRDSRLKHSPFVVADLKIGLQLLERSLFGRESGRRRSATSVRRRRRWLASSSPTWLTLPE
jgi:hypothetical protein